MNGYSEMREVAVWVQMKAACTVVMHYWPDTLPSRIMMSTAVPTFAEKANTAQLTADNVEPGVRYGYDVYADGVNQTGGLDLHFNTQSLWQYRVDPPNFTIATGSCTYINETAYDRPGKAYGKQYGIFESITNAQPDMMLWLGDNVYFREADWLSRSGILRRYTHSRSLPELQPLLQTGHHYAIWDDHDYGPNDALGSFPQKRLTREAFGLFWANNGYGLDGQGGITGAFQFNDLHFFMLDNRWSRSSATSQTVPPQMLGKAQIDWLVENLAYSHAPFKIVAVGGQILNDAAVWENYANYPVEREYLLDRIAEEGIEGVVFLTGDRHHTELCRVVHKGVTMYDLTISPLTSGTHEDGDAATTNRVEGKLYNKTNFGLLEVSGPGKARVLNMRVMDADGNEVWSHQVEAASWNELP
jgi:alkaline phosphatase D